MFFSHMPELIGILVVGLLFFGPKRLPEIGGALGQGIRDFKKGMAEMHEPAPAPLAVTADHAVAEARMSEDSIPPFA